MPAKRKAAAKRELIDTGTNKLFARRNKRGTSFKEVTDVSRSLAADRRRKAKKVVPRDRVTGVISGARQGEAAPRRHCFGVPVSAGRRIRPSDVLSDVRRSDRLH
jgi:hypothetical protein